MRKFITLLSVLMLSTLLAWTQGTVSGVVKSPAGDAVPFAEIKLGNGIKTTTDANGVFTIKATAGSELTITAKGYETKTAIVGAGFNTFTIAKTGATEDLIITAQGIKRKPRDLGTAISRVSAKELTTGQSPNLAQGLTGKASGLIITQTSSGVNNNTKVVLRGFRSITGSNDALIVLDGSPAPANVFNYLNPNDIADVTILKGGQAATLYGSDGVNGAILITTKKGTKGSPEIRFNSSVNIDAVSYLPETQNTYGNGSNYGGINSAENYRPYENQSYGDRYDGSIRGVGRTVNAAGDYLTLPYAAIKNVRKKAFDRGVTYTNDVSLSGGSADSKFSLSAQAVSTKGVIPKDKLDRYSFRASSSRDFGKLSVNFNANVVNEKVNYTTSTFVDNVLNTAAHFDPKFYRKWQINPYANPNGYYNAYTPNPYFELDNERRVDDKTFVNANIEATYRITPWLSITDRLGYQYSNLFGKSTQGKFIFSNFAKGLATTPASGLYAGSSSEDYSGATTDIFGSVSDLSNFGQRLNNDVFFTARKTFNKFEVSGVVGVNLQVRKGRAVNIGSTSILIDGLPNVAFRTGELTGSETKSEVRKYGYYADANIGYNNYLNLHLTGRIDGTSVFYAKDRKSNQYTYGYYGADVSAVLSDIIPSLKSNKTLNFLKVRASYSLNGNDNLDPYNLSPIFGIGPNFPFGSLAATTVGNSFPEKTLKPEFVKTVDAGIEAAFLDNRINVEVSAYNAVSTDQVLTTQVSPTIGYLSNILNIGKTRNWGFEVDLKTQIVRAKNWGFDVSLRYSMNENKAIELAKGANDLALFGNTQASVYVEKDLPFPYLRAVSYLRDPETNRVIVDRTNGYPIAAPGLKSFGRTTPRDVIGVTANVRYKDFSLSTTAEYRGGHVIYNGVGRTLTNSGAGKLTTSFDRRAFIFPNSSYADGTGKYVANNDVPTLNGHYTVWVDYMSTIAENFVTSAAFWKLRDLSLTYTVPSNIVRKAKIFKSATIGLYGRNLLMITPKENIYGDPEFLAANASTGGTVSNGIGFNDTEGARPSVRSYGLTFNFGF